MNKKTQRIALIPLLVIVQVMLIGFVYITYIIGCESEEKEIPFMLSEYEADIYDISPPRASLGWYPRENLVSIPEDAYSKENGFRLGVVIAPRVQVYDTPGNISEKELFIAEPFWITKEETKNKDTYFGFTDFNGKSGWLIGGTRDFVAETFSPMRLVIRKLNAKYHDADGKNAGRARRDRIKRYIGVADKGGKAAFALDHKGQTVFLDITDTNFLAEDIFYCLYLRPEAMYNKASEILDKPIYGDTAARADWFVAT